MAGNGDVVVHLIGEILKSLATIAARITNSTKTSGGGSLIHAASNDPQVTELALQVQEMSKALNKLILSGGHGGLSFNQIDKSTRGWFSVLLLSLGCGGVLHMSGWKVFPFNLFDSFLVTRNMFKSGISSIGSQVEHVQHKLKQMRVLFAKKVEDLDAKQESCIENVKDLNENVNELGEQMDKMARDVTHMGNGLGAVDTKIDHLSVSTSIFPCF